MPSAGISPVGALVAVCGTLTKTGKRCPNPRAQGLDTCNSHSKAGRAARSKAARAKRTAAAKPLAAVEIMPMRTRDDVLTVLEDSTARVRARLLDSQRGYAIANLVRAAISAIEMPQRVEDRVPDAHETPAPAKARPSWAPPDLDVVEGGASS